MFRSSVSISLLYYDYDGCDVCPHKTITDEFVSVKSRQILRLQREVLELGKKRRN